MSKPNLRTINPIKFLKMDGIRKQKIESAEAKPLPPLGSYKPNQLAAALHPKRQFLIVDKIIEHSADVKTFVFVPDASKGTTALAYFAAGQYLSLTLKIGQATVTRPYSLSSSPKESLEGKYTLTIKRVDGGLATNYILDNWCVGTEVVASAPLGDFTYEPLRDAKKIIGLAGGSGITPFFSLAKAIADGDEDAELTLLYGSRTKADVLFLKEFSDIEKKCDKFRLVNVLSNEEAEGCEHGFITAELIKKYAPEGEPYSIFMCGPQAMYDFADKEIATLGLRRKFVRHELFGEYHNPQRNEDYPIKGTETFKITVHIADETKTIEASANDTILCSLEKNGIPAPARCRSGICGWCHSRLISGDVYVPKSVDGRRLADFKFGYIHPCCTYPVSDVEIDVPPFRS